MPPTTPTGQISGSSDNMADFLTGDFLKLRVGNAIVLLHRRLLEHKVPLLKSTMGLDAMKAATTKIFANVEKAVFANFVGGWLYTDSYTDPALLEHVKLYVYACRYDIQGLKPRVVKTFRRALRHAELSGAEVVEFIETVAKSTEMYGGEMDALRDVVLQTAAGRVDRLVESKEFTVFVEAGGPAVVQLVKEMGRKLGGA